MVFAWRGKGGRLNRQYAAEIDDVPTIRELLRSVPDVYDSQWWMDRPCRRAAFALYGTHAYADLDTYNVSTMAGLSHDAVARKVLQHCDDTDTPRPSAITCSGRGHHLKWSFAETIGREHVGRMVAVNRALATRFCSLGGDPRATDATRLLRVTGSLHSGARRLVEVLHLETRDGLTITYDPLAFSDHLVPHVNRAPTRGAVLPPADTFAYEARAGQRPARDVRHFTRESWHWALIEDMRLLPQLRWHGGVVPEGWRDTFAFLIHCQMLRIFLPDKAFKETLAVVSTMIEPEFLQKHLVALCRAAMQRAYDAYSGRGWVSTYRHGKQRLIELLAVTPGEMQHMAALIDDAEYAKRHRERERARRRAAGATERAAWLAERAERQMAACILHERAGLTWQEVADAMDLPTADAARKLAARVR
jgi:hypothetical protein